MKRALYIAIPLAVVLVLAGWAGFLWLPDSYIEEGLRIGKDLWNQLADRPVLLFGLIVILPAFPIPLTPFLILGGIVFAELFGDGLGAAMAASAVGLNILWTYFLTTGPLHSLAEKILSRFGYRVPKIPAGDFLKFSYLIRVTPVFPLCVQNYLLGLLGVPLHLYLLASWTTQVPLAFAVALTAGAILRGNLALILIAVAVLLLLMIGLKWLRRRLRKDPELKEVDVGISEDVSANQPMKP